MHTHQKMVLAGISLVGTLLILFLLMHTKPTPEVYTSWSTKGCVKVVPNAEFSCNNLPEKYTIVWVR